DDVDALADIFNETLRKSPVERKENPKYCTFDPRKPLWKSNITRAASAHRNAITPPSKESGGIPEPTPEYLAASLLPLENLTEAQHLLVVIDLNGTLLFRPNKRNPSSLIARPNTGRFLKYCIDTFSVVIWSSARPANVDLMCNQILNADSKKKVVDIWARDKFDLTLEDYNLRTMCYKRLTRLWNDPKIAASHPGFQLGERWNHTNTVLVDDSPEKGRSEPYNLITIPQFLGDAHEQGQILPQVHDYLNSLSLHSNVAAYLRACPFQAVMPEAPSVHLEGTRQFRSSLKPAEAASHSASKVRSPEFSN
ncbi:phosphoprotein phosphatase, partial [Diplocarpon rosae]